MSHAQEHLDPAPPYEQKNRPSDLDRPQPAPRIRGAVNRVAVDRTDDVPGGELSLVGGAAIDDVHDQRPASIGSQR